MESSETQAVSGDITSADRALVPPVGHASPPAKGTTTGIEAAKRDKTPAAPASVHRKGFIVFGYRCCLCGSQYSSAAGSKFRIVKGYKRRVCPACLDDEAQAKAA